MQIAKSRIITHRGLEPTRENFYNESSYEAFQNHLSRGFAGIEFDPNPTMDGFVVLHDATLSRFTDGKDQRPISTITTDEVTSTPLSRGRIPSLTDVMELIKESNTFFNALHLKARLQTPTTLNRLISALMPYEDIFEKIIVFDVKADVASQIKSTFPSLRLAPSIAHPYDISRYNNSVGGTLMTINDALALRKKGYIDGVWGDEWDTLDEGGKTKQFYTKENFDQLHDAGLFIAVVTPELHGTSPGLYGGESHSDASDQKVLMTRIRRILEAGADFFCTDFPEEVSRL